MKIEVGKFYCTRDGRKVRIYATDGDGIYTVHGAFCYENGKWGTPATWLADGRFSYGYSDSPGDIVSEWADPKPRLIAWVKNAAPGEAIEIEFTRSDESQNPNHIWRRAPWLDEPLEDKA